MTTDPTTTYLPTDAPPAGLVSFLDGDGDEWCLHENGRWGAEIAGWTRLYAYEEVAEDWGPLTAGEWDVPTTTVALTVDLPRHSVVATVDEAWVNTGNGPDGAWRQGDDLECAEYIDELLLSGAAKVLRVGTGEPS